MREEASMVPFSCPGESCSLRSPLGILQLFAPSGVGLSRPPDFLAAKLSANREYPHQEGQRLVQAGEGSGRHFWGLIATRNIWHLAMASKAASQKAWGSRPAYTSRWPFRIGCRNRTCFWQTWSYFLGHWLCVLRWASAE